MKKLFLTLTVSILFIPFGMSQELSSYVPTDGLVAYYPFNGNANDESGNGNHGTVNGATLANDQNGNENKAYEFTVDQGASWGSPQQEIEIGFNSSMNSNFLTLSAWVNPRVKPSPYNDRSHSIFGRWDGGVSNEIFRFGIGNDNALYFQINDGNNNVENYHGGNIPFDSWTHVAAVLNEKNIKLYVNGQMVSDQLFENNINTTGSSDLTIASMPMSNGTWYFFDGYLDEMGYWNRALTEQEVQNLYTSSTGDILLNGVVSAENNQIKNVADPTHAQDAATKAYIDSLISDLQEQIDTLQSTSDSAKAPMLAVPGQYQGWSPKDAPLIAASAPGQTDFEGFIYMDIDEANNLGFKFVEGVDEVYEWGNPDWGQSKTGAQGTLVIHNEDNITVDTDGLYYLQVDTAAGTYSTTLMSLGLIGSATPTGWDSDTDFVYDATNNVLSLDINLSNGGEYKIRANNGWDIGFPGQFGPDLDGDGFLDSRQGMWVHENATGNYRIILDVFTARKYTLTVTAL